MYNSLTQTQSNIQLYKMEHNMHDLISITDADVDDFIYKYEKYVDTKSIDLCEISDHIKSTIPNKISMNDFYNYVANYCASKINKHYEYGQLAARICVDRLHRYTKSDILEMSTLLYQNVDNKNNHSPLISKEIYDIIIKNYEKLNNEIVMDRDYNFDFFGIRTLETSYLLKIHEKKKTFIVERPQHLWMRTALGIHKTDVDKAIETYHALSQRFFTHATPTLFNAGTNRAQCSSCFLFGMKDDLSNMFDQLKKIATISKWSGGIGVHIADIRGKNSIIRGTNGKSDGQVPLCMTMNIIAKWINQGGKRKGSIAVYNEPWHTDIFQFCELRKQNSGNEDNRARDLFLALWIPDLFMKRVENDETWSLMCPDECPNLNKTYGDEFEQLYIQYESDKRFVKQVKARELWKHIIECQLETGFPYMLFKDSVNRASNQKNVGVIRSSNLCTEIVEYSDENVTAVCNLASICLPKYIITTGETKSFDYNKLGEITRIIVRNLDKLIDVNYYPVDCAKTSNEKHRPIGIGVQGLADVYNIFLYDYESSEAKELNKHIFETIYFNALYESKELAKKYGKYSTFEGSPFSEGKLQYHMWKNPDTGKYMTNDDLVTKDIFDWNGLTEDVKQFGTRNSLLTALMPTAGTSQIMKCYESFEPYMSNIFIRATMVGEFVVINENLMKELIKINLWSEDMRKKIIIYNGSVQNIDEIPQNIKNVFKTAFEIKLRNIIDQSADRGPFIDQSQSMNLFMANPNYKKLTSAHFHSWKRGLKTGMYYLRTKAAVDPIKFGIPIEDMMRLTGSKNVIDLITNNYGINRSTPSPINNIKKEEILPINIHTKDKLTEIDNDDEESTMCVYDPTKKAEGCLMCSS